MGHVGYDSDVTTAPTMHVLAPLGLHPSDANQKKSLEPSGVPPRSQPSRICTKGGRRGFSWDHNSLAGRQVAPIVGTPPTSRDVSVPGPPRRSQDRGTRDSSPRVSGKRILRQHLFVYLGTFERVRNETSEPTRGPTPVEGVRLLPKDLTSDDPRPVYRYE